jgi:hypothetical protein
MDGLKCPWCKEPQKEEDVSAAEEWYSGLPFQSVYGSCVRWFCDKCHRGLDFPIFNDFESDCRRLREAKERQARESILFRLARDDPPPEIVMTWGADEEA